MVKGDMGVSLPANNEPGAEGRQRILPHEGATVIDSHGLLNSV
jgi:hypothetical protein